MRGLGERGGEKKRAERKETRRKKKKEQRSLKERGYVKLENNRLRKGGELGRR